MIQPKSLRLVTLLIGFIGILYIVYFSATENFKLLFLPIIVLITYQVIKRPQWVGFIFILANVNFLGMVDPNDFLRLPGVFKFTDIIFILMLGIYFFDVIVKRAKFDFNEHSKTIAIIVLVFILIVVTQTIITAVRFDLPFISTIKVSRGYFYLLSFFYFIRFFYSENSFNKLVKFLTFIVIVQLLMMFIEISGLNLFGAAQKIQLNVGDYNVTRVYMPAQFYAFLIFFIATTLIIMKKCINKKWLTFIAFVSLLSIILSYTRTYWLTVLLGLVFIFILINTYFKLITIKLFFFPLLLLIPVILLTNNPITERIFSIATEAKSEEGNFSYRFKENPQRLELFYKYPLLGPGFVHSDYAASLFNFKIDDKHLSESQIKRALMLQTNDSGFITLLVSFGLIGIFWVFYKIYFLMKINRSIPNTNRNKPFIIANIAFILAVWLTSITTYGFMYPDGIVALAISLYLIALSSSTRLIKY